jgi:hypothetical protein
VPERYIHACAKLPGRAMSSVVAVKAINAWCWQESNVQVTPVHCLYKTINVSLQIVVQRPAAEQIEAVTRLSAQAAWPSLELKEKARKQDRCDRAMALASISIGESYHPTIAPRLHPTNPGTFSYWTEVQLRPCRFTRGERFGRLYEAVELRSFILLLSAWHEYPEGFAAKSLTRSWIFC